MTAADRILSQFQAAGLETCFHGRHIDPQIYAGLDGANWGLSDYEARGGYQALCRLSYRTEVELYAPPVSGTKVPCVQLR